MNSKETCAVICLLCISFITISHSLSNDAREEKQTGEQSNQNKKSGDSEKDAIYQILKHMKNLDQSAKNLTDQLESLKMEMNSQIVELSSSVNKSNHRLHIILDNLNNISTIRRVDEYSTNLTQPVNNSMETKTTQQDKTYLKNITEFMNSLNQRLDDLETIYLKNVTNLVNSLNHQFGELETKIKESKYRPHDEIVQDIRSDRFSEAAQKLKQADNGTYKNAVREVYNNQIDNVVLLRRFWDSIRDTEIKNNLYQALYDEIKIDNVIDKQLLSKVSWSIFGEEIPNLIIHSIQEDGFVVHLAHLKCFQCMVDISEQVIGKLWGNLTLEKIMQKARNKLKSTDEQIAFQTATFHELESRKELYTYNSVTLAREMKLTMEGAGYQFVSSEMKSQYEAIKNKLPRSIIILVFSSKVCIRNTRYNEYLYSGTDSEDLFNRSSILLHRVYTRMLGDRDKSPEFKWRVSFGFDHAIFFINDHFNKEFLCAYYHVYDDIRRYVFTHATGGWNDVAWDLEFDGDNIYMKNFLKLEYLFADLEIKKNEKDRYAFTYLPKNKTLDSVWQVEDCS